MILLLRLLSSSRIGLGLERAKFMTFLNIRAMLPPVRLLYLAKAGKPLRGWGMKAFSYRYMYYLRITNEENKLISIFKEAVSVNNKQRFKSKLHFKVFRGVFPRPITRSNPGLTTHQCAGCRSD